MKKFFREHNIENLEKYIIKANILKKLSYISIVIDLISFTAMEVLKLIYDDSAKILSLIISFIVKVNLNIKLDNHSFCFMCNFDIFNKIRKNKISYNRLLDV